MKARKISPAPRGAYGAVLTGVVGLVESARSTAARSVNAIMTATYWAIGRSIVEEEQRGAERAGYGEELIVKLSRDLHKRFGRGFGRANLFQMRSFFLTYRDIVQTPSGLSPARALPAKVQTLSGLSSYRRPRHATPDPLVARLSALSPIAARFLLPWSHYVRLLSVRNPNARHFYEQEALRGGWSIRQLDRQVNTQFYERTALSKDKLSMLRKGGQRRRGDLVSTDAQLKDPFVLEFLGMKDQFSETQFEGALVAKLEGFLLELGTDFAFVGRQRRLRVGDEWYRVDLVFFHRRLRCLVLIDLKLGRFTHADAGQMHLYLNYARKHWALRGENPPVGLVLCAHRDAAVAKYALEGLPTKVLAAEYRTALPREQALVAEIENSRREIERELSQTRGAIPTRWSRAASTTRRTPHG